MHSVPLVNMLTSTTDVLAEQLLNLAGAVPNIDTSIFNAKYRQSRVIVVAYQFELFFEEIA